MVFTRFSNFCKGFPNKNEETYTKIDSCSLKKKKIHLFANEQSKNDFYLNF